VRTEKGWRVFLFAVHIFVFNDWIFVMSLRLRLSVNLTPAILCVIRWSLLSCHTEPKRGSAGAKKLGSGQTRQRFLTFSVHDPSTSESQPGSLKAGFSSPPLLRFAPCLQLPPTAPSYAYQTAAHAERGADRFDRKFPVKKIENQFCSGREGTETRSVRNEKERYFHN